MRPCLLLFKEINTLLVFGQDLLRLALVESPSEYALNFPAIPLEYAPFGG
jgi:hypothetical protein